VFPNGIDLCVVLIPDVVCSQMVLITVCVPKPDVVCSVKACIGDDMFPVGGVSPTKGQYGCVPGCVPRPKLIPRSGSLAVRCKRAIMLTDGDERRESRGRLTFEANSEACVAA
jgi:hypothetical protein